MFMSFFFINCNSQEGIKTISTKELKVLLENKKIQLVDVRTPREVADGTIENAFLINFFDENFSTKIAEQLNKNQPIYLYCRSGNRSGKASKILQEKGYKVYNVLGGYNKWKQEN